MHSKAIFKDSIGHREIKSKDPEGTILSSLKILRESRRLASEVVTIKQVAIINPKREMLLQCFIRQRKKRDNVRFLTVNDSLRFDMLSQKTLHYCGSQILELSQLMLGF